MGDTTNHSRKKSKKKKKPGKALLVIFVLFVLTISLCFGILAGNNNAALRTETVLKGTAEDKITVSGYMIRNESVVNAPESGIISFRSDEEKRVSSGATLAVIYTGEVNDDVKNELSGIHERIAELDGSSNMKNLFAGDSIGGTMQVLNNIDAIVSSVYSGNVSSVSKYKDDITRIIRKEGEDGQASMTTIEQLAQRQKELEASIAGSSVYIYSDRAGVLTSSIDGYEEYFGIDKMDSITPEYLSDVPKIEKSKKNMAEKGQPCLKIVDNYVWYYTAILDEKWAEDIKVGADISIRFKELSEEKLDGEVYKISEPINSKCSIVIKSSSLFQGLYTQRKLTAEIIRKTYRGFKVSKEAVHIDSDGNYYVFINSEGIVRRRNADILYSDDYYAIIKEDNSQSNNLLLYDEVIVNGVNIKEGKAL